MREAGGDGVDGMLGEKKTALWHIDWKWPILSKCSEGWNPMRHPMVLANGALCAYLILDL